MSKNWMIALIAILLALTLALVSFMGVAIWRNGMAGDWSFSQTTTRYDNLALVNTRVIPLEQIDQIDVSYVSEDILLVQGDGDELELREYMNRDDPELLASVSTSNNRITIQHGARERQWNFWMGILRPRSGLRSRVELVLPASYRGELSLSSVSGDLYTNDADWTLSSLNLSTTSGDVDFRNVTASGTLAVSSVSGDCHLGDVTAKDIDTSTTSGGIFFAQAAGKVDVSTISGDVELDGGVTGGSISTTSGDIEAVFSLLTTDVTLSSVSGDLALGIAPAAAFRLEADTISGDIDLSVDSSALHQRKRSASGSVGQNPVHMVDVSTTSGDIQLLQRP